ncbi:MAG: type IV pilus secretin PilQ [Gammaproteobacteria bacterium]
MSGTKNWLGAITVFLLVLGAPKCWATSSLDAVSFTTHPGSRVEIKLELSGPLSQDPLSFTIDNPARIALDLPDTRLNLAERHRAIGIGPAQSVSAVEAGGRTRVVLNLVRMVPYSVRREGNQVVVMLQGSEHATVPAFATSVPATGPATTTSVPGVARGPAIEDIDFRRGEAGEGRVIVTLSDPGIASNIREEGGRIVVDFEGVALPERLDRRLDVLDFATPIKEVDTSPYADGARMVITPSGHYEHLAYQSDNVLTLEVKPLTKEEEEALKKEKFGYTGERLSLNFQDIEVRAVLQLIADFTGLNMVASDSVTGNVTLRLKNVPWDQALDIILKSKGLGMRQTGNVIMVAPQEEIATREKLELETQKQLAELAPLRTEFMAISYGKAVDLAAMLKAKENRLLTERGNVTVDQRTNTLLVQETPEKLAEIRKLIATLDVPVRQVLIESRIVIANQDFSKALGVRFGYSKNTRGNRTINDPTVQENEFGAIIGGKRPGDVSYGDVGTAFINDQIIENAEDYIVDLPAAVNPAGALGLAVGKIGSYLLQLELSALQEEGRGEIISSPRVITADQKEAVIESGTEIPYQEATSSGATSIAFRKAVLALRAVPHITPDDRVNMTLKVSKDAPILCVTESDVPCIDTRNLSTEVLVDNGETVVLGGVYEQTNSSAATRVPFFGEIPYFGALFRRTVDQRDKDELLIFVTPKILKETLSLR